MVSLESFNYALKGFKMVLSSERNARIHLVFAFIAIILTILLHIEATHVLFVIISIALVFFAEIVNTAIEKTLDTMSKENNQMVKHIKDMTAAGVLVTAISAVIVAIVVFLPPVANLVSGYL